MSVQNVNKNNAAPPEQRGAALSVHAIANTDGGGLYSPLGKSGNREVLFHKPFIMCFDVITHILETDYLNGIGIVLVVIHSNTAPTIKVGCILNGAVYAQNVSGVDSVTGDCDFRISIVNNFRRNFQILDRYTKFGGELL